MIRFARRRAFTHAKFPVALHLFITVFVTALLASVPVAAQTPAAFTIDDLVKIRRVGDPQVSPDGRSIAFTITDTDYAANRRTTQIYLMPTAGGEPRQLTNDKASSSTPRWSPDGRLLAFVSARDGEAQIHTLDVASGATQKITSISTGADAPVWSPDGKLIAFVSEIYPECADDACNAARLKQVAESKVKAKIADRLLFRHWNAWKEGKRSHVFVVASTGGAARDLTPGDYDAPPFSLGGPSDYAFSPDSRELVFARNTDKVEAVSTNGDLFVVPVTGGEARRITGSNQGADLSPQYSPDGRFIAYRSQPRATFEADRWHLMLYDRQANRARSVTPAFDQSVESFTFTADGKQIIFTALERGRHPIYTMKTDGSNIRKLIEGFNDDVKLTADNRTIVFTRNSLTSPIEIFRADANGKNVTQLTKINSATLARFRMRPAEEMTWKGAGDTPVSGWLIKPADFDASKKYPLLVLIHGGPQSAWNDAWSYRWNPQVFASAGYIVFMPNPRGSLGYGQKFTDEISGRLGRQSLRRHQKRRRSK
jgi:dipeptidyl aminopeptidase/acylaminoacyl peptidase